MTSRAKQKAETNKALWDAFERLKKGTPWVVTGNYKISPSTVQKEAGKPMGTIQLHPDVHQAVKDYKAQQQASEQGLKDKHEVYEAQLAKLRKKWHAAEEKVTHYREETQAEKNALKAEQARTLSLVAVLVKEVPKAKREKLADLLQHGVDNVVTFRPRIDDGEDD